MFSSVQSLSRVWLFVTPWTAVHHASLTITNSRSLPKLMSIESVMPSNHLILSSPSPPAFSLSQHQGLFKWVSSSHQVAKILEFQLQYQFFLYPTISSHIYIFNWQYLSHDCFVLCLSCLLVLSIGTDVLPTFVFVCVSRTLMCTRSSVFFL